MECTESGRKYQYNYNSRGQLTGYTELTASGNAYTDLAQSFFWYDDLNRLEYTQTSFRYAVGDTNYLSDADYYDAVGYWYTYDNSASGNSDAGTDVGALTQLEILGGGLNTGATISYGYDSLYRLTAKTITAEHSAGFSQTVNYGYRQVSTGRTSGQVSSYQSTIGDTTTRYTYTYDSSGNITRITDQSGNVTRYTYDKLGQLTREDNPYLGKTYVYAYDKAGNRTSKTTYDYTTGTLGTATSTQTYTYNEGTWGDQLKGTTYDEIGNPDTYNGYSLTWNGRQLMEMSMNAGQFRYSFTYNDEGIRTSKTYGSTTHYYTLNGSQIVTETWVTKSSDGTETPNHFLVYLYDESGAPIGLQYRNKTYEKYDFDTYYFEKNLQGDIIAIYTEAGTKIGSYTYDAWGNCTPLPESGATTPQKQIVRMFNPFRYRGYYYDYDTGLYYLRSRYYNPATGRFLNADSYLYNRMLGFNLFLYCDNNPVNYLDPYGEDAEALLAGWASAGWGLAAVDGPLPIGDIIYVAGCFVLGGVVIIEAMTNIDEIADTTLPTYDLPMVDALPGNVTATDAATIGISIGATVAKEKYDPNPYKRPGQKKQGRENRNGSRKKPGWEPRNNKRSKTPAEPKKHTPGKDHRKYFKSIGYEKIEIYEVK